MKHYMSAMSMDRLIAAERPQANGMIALIPTEADARRLTIPGWEPAEELHMTLYFLGEAESIDSEKVVSHVGGIQSTGSFEANLWAACHFNPTGEHPCATYLVGGQAVADWRTLVSRTVQDNGLSDAEQHVPWIPHITIGYGMSPSLLTKTGPITFDRLRIAFGDEITDIPL